MPRPLKTGLDYFPLDCNFDNKVRALIGKYKASGFGIFIHIFQLIYNNGYFLKITNEMLEDISIEMGEEEDFISKVIEFACRRGIFSEEAYKKKILTSHGIQKRFIEATKRRKEFNIVDKHRVNVDNNLINVDGNPQAGVVNVDIGTQSKVKESKVKESISLFEECWSLFGKYGNKKKALEYWNKLTDKEHQAIKERIPVYMKVVKAGRIQKQFEGWINPQNRIWETTYENQIESTPESDLNKMIEARNQ